MHLMTDPKGNSEFCFPETLSVSQGQAEGNKSHCFPAGPVMKCFVIPPNSKLEKNCEEFFCFMLAGS